MKWKPTIKVSGETDKEITDEETKGNVNYEKRLFDNFYKKIGDIISNRWSRE